MEKESLLNIESHRVFNMDESGFTIVPNDKKVLAEKGSSAVYQIVAGNDKSQITVLFIACANGELTPPLILFNGKKLPKKDVLLKMPKHWAFGVTDEGWMTGDSFFFFYVQLFYKTTKRTECKISNCTIFRRSLFPSIHFSHETM